MIKVERTSKPNILSNQEENWKTQYLNAIHEHLNQPNNNRKKNKDTAERKYNHQGVKSALKAMFSGKCAYCESQITHIDYGDIEHFYHKSRYPENVLIGKIYYWLAVNVMVKPTKAIIFR